MSVTPKAKTYIADLKALYELGAFSQCLQYINEALEDDPHYARGLWIKDQIIKEYLEGTSLTRFVRCNESRENDTK